jgi:hypothetical protein
MMGIESKGMDVIKNVNLKKLIIALVEQMRQKIFAR